MANPTRAAASTTNTNRASNKATPSALTTLEGLTLRWTFRDGPTAATTFEHLFLADGSIEYRMLGVTPPLATKARAGAAVRIRENVFAVSYLGAQGFTLTAVLDFDTHRVVGFASNDKQWFQQEGDFEVVGSHHEPTAAKARSAGRPTSHGDL